MLNLSALQLRMPLPPRVTPGTHFYLRLSRSQGHSADGRIKSMIDTNNPIGNRICDPLVLHTFVVVGIINSTTRSHLVGYFYTISTRIMMHRSMNIKYTSKSLQSQRLYLKILLQQESLLGLGAWCGHPEAAKS